MRNRLFLPVLAAIVFWVEPVAARSFSADWLSGEWRGAGTIAGGESTATLVASAALEDTHRELDYRLVSFLPEGEPMRFAGRGFYRLGGDQAWTGHWVDSGGASHRLVGRIEDDTLIAHWGERGRSVYRRVGDDRLEVVDSMRDGEGEWREFGRQQFVRTE